MVKTTIDLDNSSADAKRKMAAMRKVAEKSFMLLEICHDGFEVNITQPRSERWSVEQLATYDQFREAIGFAKASENKVPEQIVDLFHNPDYLPFAQSADLDFIDSRGRPEGILSDDRDMQKRLLGAFQRAGYAGDNLLSRAESPACVHFGKTDEPIIFKGERNRVLLRQPFPEIHEGERRTDIHGEKIQLPPFQYELSLRKRTTFLAAEDFLANKILRAPIKMKPIQVLNKKQISDLEEIADEGSAAQYDLYALASVYYIVQSRNELKQDS